MFSQATSPLDCEQSLFFFRFSKGSARAHASVERRSRETRETRAAARQEKEKKWKKRDCSPLPSRAFSHARGHFLRVAVALLDGLSKNRDCS